MDRKMISCVDGLQSTNGGLVDESHMYLRVAEAVEQLLACAAGDHWAVCRCTYAASRRSIPCATYTIIVRQMVNAARSIRSTTDHYRPPVRCNRLCDISFTLLREYSYLIFHRRPPRECPRWLAHPRPPRCALRRRHIFLLYRASSMAFCRFRYKHIL